MEWKSRDFQVIYEHRIPRKTLGILDLQFKSILKILKHFLKILKIQKSMNEESIEEYQLEIINQLEEEFKARGQEMIHEYYKVDAMKVILFRVEFERLQAKIL